VAKDSAGTEQGQASNEQWDRYEAGEGKGVASGRGHLLAVARPTNVAAGINSANGTKALLAGRLAGASTVFPGLLLATDLLAGLLALLLALLLAGLLVLRRAALSTPR